MEVILLQKVRNLGALGDQVRVKPGFARNYLIPYGKAVAASAENKERFEAQRAELERAQADSLTSARSRAEKLNGLTIQIARKVSEEGRLFGSVGTKDIVDAVRALGVELSKAEVELPRGALKEVGDHEITLALHAEVDAKIIVSVVGEK